MRIGFLTNVYPLDKQSRISSFYKWLKENKQDDNIELLVDSDTYNYDKYHNFIITISNLMM